MWLVEELRGYRTAFAVSAAVLAIAICIYERHVRVVLSEPATYTSPLHHKCGLLMLACVSWAVMELTRRRLLRST